MNSVERRRLAAVLLYCGVVSVIVNGQSTTDDDTNSIENVQHRARLAQLEANLASAIGEIAKLKDDLAAVAANKPNERKFNVQTFIVYSLDHGLSNYQIFK